MPSTMGVQENHQHFSFMQIDNQQPSRRLNSSLLGSQMKDNQSTWAPIQNNKVKFDGSIVVRTEILKTQSVRDSKEFKGSPRKAKNPVTSVEDELKMVRNIYDNFEKHKLPVKNQKQHRQLLKTLQLAAPTSNATNPVLFERAKQTLLYDDDYQKFQPQGYLKNYEFFIPKEDSLLSGEIRKKVDSDEYYKLRSQHNTDRYLEMLEQKLKIEKVPNS